MAASITMKRDEEGLSALEEEGLATEAKQRRLSPSADGVGISLLPLAPYSDDEGEEDDGGEDPERNRGIRMRRRQVELRRDCPYLDTVNRQHLHTQLPPAYEGVNVSGFNHPLCDVSAISPGWRNGASSKDELADRLPGLNVGNIGFPESGGVPEPAKHPAPEL